MRRPPPLQIKRHKVGDTTNCRRCGELFVVSAAMVRWGRYVCPPCQVKAVDAYTKDNREKKREWSRRSDKKRSGQRKARTAAYRKANPEKRAAHQAVQTAVRNGSLTRKPCERCGAVPTHAHHDDYSKPLDVRWLCHTCHMKDHGNYAEEE